MSAVWPAYIILEGKFNWLVYDQPCCHGIECWAVL